MSNIYKHVAQTCPINMIPNVNTKNSDRVETITYKWDDYPVLSSQQLKINTETGTAELIGMRNNAKSDLGKLMSSIFDKDDTDNVD